MDKLEFRNEVRVNFRSRLTVETTFLWPKADILDNFFALLSDNHAWLYLTQTDSPDVDSLQISVDLRLEILLTP